MSKTKNLAQIFIGFVLFLAVFASFVASAVNSPIFPSCENPEGSLKVSYSLGTHGIPGKNETYTGSDSVYRQESGNLIQCFCPELGATGIQTDWWRDPGLSTSEIEDYKTRGWIFVPDGLAWGLDPVVYLAKNHDFTCRAIGGGNPTVGDILGLAATGNIKSIYALFILGGLILTLSTYFSYRHSKKSTK